MRALIVGTVRGTLLVLALTATSPAAAQSWDGCTLDAPQLWFGDYDFLDASPTRSTTRITIHCRGPLRRLRPQVELSAGSSQTYANRTQLSGSNILSYNIYVDYALTQVAGDGSGGSSALFLEPDETGTAQKVDLYGAVAPQQLSPPGAYSDTIYVTIIF
jgi:spore coat protein U-like protein